MKTSCSGLARPFFACCAVAAVLLAQTHTSGSNCKRADQSCGPCTGSVFSCDESWTDATGDQWGQIVESFKNVARKCHTYTTVVHIPNCQWDEPGYVRICGVQCCFIVFGDGPSSTYQSSTVIAEPSGSESVTPCQN